MGERQINIRTSEEDKADLKQAAENLSKLTDEKASISKTVRAGVRLLAETDPNKPELFFVNRNALRELEKHLTNAQEQLQGICNEYLKAVGSPPDMAEIEGWYGTSASNFMVANTELIRETILNKKYFEQRNKYPDLQFTLDNIKPPDIEALIEVASNLIFAPLIEAKEYFFWPVFAIISGKVELLPEAIEQVKNRWRSWACTIEEKARLQTARKLCASLDGMKVANPEQLNIPGVVAWDSEAGVYMPAEQYVKGFTKIILT